MVGGHLHQAVGGGGSGPGTSFNPYYPYCAPELSPPEQRPPTCIPMDGAWTRWGSEETAPLFCAGNMGATGFACDRDNCDNVKLFCGFVAPSAYVDLELDYRKTYWLPYFSEEGAASGQNQHICEGIVTGIQCTGGWCDNIRIQCTPLLATGKLKQCGTAKWYRKRGKEEFCGMGTA